MHQARDSSSAGAAPRHINQAFIINVTLKIRVEIKQHAAAARSLAHSLARPPTELHFIFTFAFA